MTLRSVLIVPFLVLLKGGSVQEPSRTGAGDPDGTDFPGASCPAWACPTRGGSFGPWWPGTQAGCYAPGSLSVECKRAAPCWDRVPAEQVGAKRVWYSLP